MVPVKLLTFGVAATLCMMMLFVTASAQCEDIEKYFGDVGSVNEIDLGSVIRVDCPANDEGGPLEEILIASGTSLTVKSTEDFVRFVNLRFTVEEGATLVFDMPVTRFGPNSGATEGGTGYMLDVYDGATVTFMGKFRASQIDNIRSVFYNSGYIDFKGDSLFNNNGNVFRSNYNGTLKFRGDTVFRNNAWLALDLGGPDSYVRFSKTATFDNNARGFDGATGCAVANTEGTVIFRDDAYFSNHRCDEGSAVYNGGTMKFYGKVQFEDNTSQSFWGGGVRNGGGSLLFRKAVQFNRNDAEIGGGLAVTGGEVTFRKAVKFDSNQADETGGAFAVTDGALWGGNTAVVGGTLTFEKPEVVRYEDNFIYANPYNDEAVTGCSLAYVEEGATLIGFDVEDVCMEVTV